MNRVARSEWIGHTLKSTRAVSGSESRVKEQEYIIVRSRENFAEYYYRPRRICVLHSFSSCDSIQSERFPIQLWCDAILTSGHRITLFSSSMRKRVWLDQMGQRWNDKCNAFATITSYLVVREFVGKDIEGPPTRRST